jgi:signal transduction histidine kinase
LLSADAFFSGWLRRALPVARVVLAGTAFLHEILSAAPSAAFSIVFGSYALFGLLLLLRKTASFGVFGLLALFSDTVYFLVLSNHLSGAALWLAALTFLYLMTAAVSSYGPREVAVIALICAAFFLAAPHAEGLRMAVAVGAVLAVMFAFVRNRLIRSLDALEHEMAESKASAARAKKEERQRIAADFHDGPLQSFISFQMRLEILRKIIERDPAAGLEDLRQLQQLAKTQITEIRTFVRSMRPITLDGANLTAAVRRIAEDFQKETGIPVTYLGSDTNLPIAPEITTDIVQMVREALHNVQKHAGATRVAVAMEATPKALEISVDDNGAGFHFSGTYNLDELDLLRLGPVSLKQRARSLNAELQLESQPGRGASLRLRIPI